MNAKLLTVLMLIVCWANNSPGAETNASDADKYLQQYGLEEIHASYAKFFTLLSEGKTVEANQILAESLPANVNPAVRDQVLRATAGLSAIFERGVEDAELIGLQKISNKSIALYYVLNSNSGPDPGDPDAVSAARQMAHAHLDDGIECAQDHRDPQRRRAIPGPRRHPLQVQGHDGLTRPTAATKLV